MVSTRNTSKNNANPPRMQNQPSNADNRPPSTLETMQANTDEVEALRLNNQRLTEELEQLTRQMRRPREARQIQEGHDIPPHEGQHNIGTPRGAETAPGAQQLTLTSSSTLDRSRYLRSQISSGYIATRPQRPEPSSSL